MVALLRTVEPPTPTPQPLTPQTRASPPRARPAPPGPRARPAATRARASVGARRRSPRRRRQDGRLFVVDLLRVVAATGVLLHHYLFSGYAEVLSPLGFALPGRVAKYGYLGADLFFLISGFIVLHSAWNQTPRAFWTARIARLFPAYWIAVTLTAGVSVLFGAGRFPIGAEQYLANLTMLNAPAGLNPVDPVYWTLWAELRFYLVIAALVFFIATPRRVSIVAWSWLGLTALLELGVLPRSTDLALNTQYSHYFIAGMALAMIYRFGPTRSWLALIALCELNALYRATQYAGELTDRYRTPIQPLVVAAAIVAFFWLMLAVALRLTPGSAGSRFTTLAALTYPLYLIHGQIGFIVFQRLGDRVSKYLLLAGTTVAMAVTAYLINRLVERPLAPVLTRMLGPSQRGRHR